MRLKAVLLVLVLLCTPAVAQRKTAAKPAPAPAVQANDEAYGKKILEYTTEKFFLTELVDHLPVSPTVPSPEKVLGYVIGTPEKLTYTRDIHRYMRELARTSPRVKVFSMGQSEEGREMILVVIGDEESVKNLDKYKNITARLADPRQLSKEEAARLISDGKAFYWASGSIHSGETGSPEMLMELAYRLAVGESPHIQAIRKNAIVMITPTTEVDGRDRMVDLYRWRKANPGKTAPSLLYWGKYVAHDNNRDGMGFALNLTRNMMKTFLEYHPTVLHDLHESVPFLYTSTGTGPYNAWLDPIVVDEWQMLAYHEIEEMTKRGVPGVWTHGFYDGWAPNYMFYVANGHNSIGRFYETFGNGGADTRERTVAAGQTTRTWFRPNPPLPRVRWSMRNNVNMQQSALLFAMRMIADQKERFLNNFYLKSRRSVEKAVTEGPAAYVLETAKRPAEAAAVANLMRIMGVEVHRLDKDTEVKGEKFAAGSYVIRMDQPYSRMADMLLDTQYFNVNDPRPYDDTGWTLGALRNIKTTRVTDTAVLGAAMSLLQGETRAEGKIAGSATTAAYILNHNTDNTLATFRFRLKDVKMLAAEEAFEHEGRKYAIGSFVIPSEGNPSGLRARLDAAVQDLGLTAHAVNAMPKVATHPLAAPRVALLHTWVNTQDEGWFRYAFDTLKIPYTYISDHVIRDTPNLRDRFDVIVFPPARGSAQRIVNGLPMRGDPIPWKGSDLTPNMAGSPDTSDDIRGGMGLQGVLHLKKFVEAGGVFVTITGNSAIPLEYGLVDGVSISETRQLNARGTVVNANVADARSPIVYGYDERFAVYFSQAPVFQAGGLGGFGGGRGGGGGGGGFAAIAGGPATGRPSGRGGPTDPDIPQGRPWNPQAAQPQRPAAPGEEPQIPEEFREQAAAQMPSPEQMPRTVLRFAGERDLRVSGMLTGESELANRPAVLDVPLGKGHIVMFATNPMWRNQTQGSYFLLFNTLLNYDNLHVGRRTGPPRRGSSGANDDEDDHSQ
jgi:hypothetical protein